MRSAKRRSVPLVLIAGAVLASAAVFSTVPSSVAIPIDGMLPFGSSAEPEPMPRWGVLFAMPTLALALWAAFRAFPTAAGERLARAMFTEAPEHVTSSEQFTRFEKTYDTIVLGVVVLVLGLHAGALAAALGAYGVAVRIVPVVFGTAMVMMGNVFPRLKPNWVAGIRTQAVLADPELWRSTHRTFGAAFVGGGLVTIAVGFIVPTYGLLCGIVAVIVASIAGFMASRPAGPRGRGARDSAVPGNGGAAGDVITG